MWKVGSLKKSTRYDLTRSSVLILEESQGLQISDPFLISLKMILKRKLYSKKAR